MDNLKGPIRYKTDIINAVNLPILGNVPGSVTTESKPIPASRG
jgi:hypothetical protein